MLIHQALRWIFQQLGCVRKPGLQPLLSVAIGVWDQVLAELRQQADRDGDLDLTLHFVGSTTVRAHQHAAGAKGHRKVRRSATAAAD